MIPIHPASPNPIAENNDAGGFGFTCWLKVSNMSSKPLPKNKAINIMLD